MKYKQQYVQWRGGYHLVWPLFSVIQASILSDMLSIHKFDLTPLYSL